MNTKTFTTQGMERRMSSFILRFEFLFFKACVYVGIGVCALEYRCPQRPEEGIGFPRAGDFGGFELPGVCARNQTEVLCKSSTCS